MKRIISFINKKVNPDMKKNDEDYIVVEDEKPKPQLLIMTFQVQAYEEIKRVISFLRKGRIIALIDLKPLREKNVVDLKMTVNKLKTVCAEVGADLASLGGDWIVVAPDAVEIERPKLPTPPEPEFGQQLDDDYHVEFY